MQIKVNKNYVLANIFFDQLAELGVKYACVSPGSRSTPLTYALSQNKKIKTYVIIDERTSGFFALGLAKQSLTPVIIITTSGTATAELYPSIIEAYQNRVPLIICTADRPAYLRNSGANQTINQDNIYKNHIRFFYETGLPDLNEKKIELLKKKTVTAFNISLFENRGPVHINFPFEKPLEPDSYTDTIEEKILSLSLPENSLKKFGDKKSKTFNKEIQALKTALKKNNQYLITIGPGKFSNQFLALLSEFSNKFNIPIFNDASSGLGFSSKQIQNIIPNFDALIRSDTFNKIFAPKINLHFGRTATSPKLEDFLSRSKTKRFVINQFGDMFDSSRKSKVIKMNEEDFLSNFTDIDINFNDKLSQTLKKIKILNEGVEQIKVSTIVNTKKVNEPGILIEVLNSIPPNSNLMIGNSTPIRDLDFIASSIRKDINVFQNRGASGIDGISSTALGICANSKYPTYLITGDLSFYHDINSLLIANQHKIPLIIILINNSGGGIFRFLPISEHKNVFQKYFLTPTNLSFQKLVEAFGVEYKELKSTSDITNHIKVSSVRKKPVVFEVKTNSEYSLNLRRKYWKKVNKFVDDYLRKYEA